MCHSGGYFAGYELYLLQVVGQTFLEQNFDLFQAFEPNLILFVHYWFKVFGEGESFQDGWKFCVIDTAVLEENSVAEVVVEERAGGGKTFAVTYAKCVALQSQGFVGNLI